MASMVVDCTDNQCRLKWWSRLIYGVGLPLLCTPIAILILLIAFWALIGKRGTSVGLEDLGIITLVYLGAVWCWFAALYGLLTTVGFALAVQFKNRVTHFACGLGIFLVTGAIGCFVLPWPSHFSP